ncbi:MAG: AMP-binding protein [Sedimenticola sp.]
MNNLWEAFQRTVRRVPEHGAIVAGERVYSFAQLADRATDFRRAYQQSGVLPGDRVLLWMQSSFHMAAATVACWGQDAIPVLMDAGCRLPQMEHALALIEPRAVVHSGDLPGSVGDPAVSVLEAAEVPRHGQINTLYTPGALPTDPASIVFTSGSTGMPKGVVQSHRNIFRGCNTVYQYLGIQDNDVLLCPVPWSFDYGYGQLLTTLLCGITHVIPGANNPFGICDSLEQHRPSILAGIPSLFAYLMGGMSPIASIDRSSIRMLTNTGGKLAAPILAQMLDAFDDAEVVLNYGLTETYRSCFLPPHLVREHSHSIGIPVPGVGIEIMREDGSPAALGEEGEIVHRGNCVCLGYWRNPDATAASLRRDPLVHNDVVAGSNALFTGDVGYRDEQGFLYYIGRRDQLLKSMGVRVSPHEVEEILLKSGLVESAAVFAQPHDLLGHEIYAALVPREPALFKLQELKKFAQRNMSQYMLPRSYVVLDNLPLTTTGKTNYRELEQLTSQTGGE